MFGIRVKFHNLDIDTSMDMRCISTKKRPYLPRFKLLQIITLDKGCPKRVLGYSFSNLLSAKLAKVMIIHEKSTDGGMSYSLGYNL